MARTKPPAEDIKELVARIRSPGGTPYAKVCVYGVNGSGKTRFAGSSPKVLILDISEEGDRSIKGVRGARVLPITNWVDIGNTYWWLKAGKHPFESVALDTITAMQELALGFVLGEAEERDPTREKQMPDKRTWGRAGQLMKGMLLAYRNLPLHVVFTAQERRIIDQDTEELTELTVDLPNSSRGVAMGCVGVLGRMTPREVRVKSGGKVGKKWLDHLIVGPNELIRTKDRTGALPPVIRKPTMPDLIEAWQS